MPGTDVFDEAEKAQGDVFDQAAQPPPVQPGFGNRFSEVTLGTQHPIAQAQSEWESLKSHPLATVGSALKTAAMAPVNLAYNAVHHPIDTITGMTGGPQFSEDLKNRNYAGMAGDMAGGITNAALLAKGPGEAAAERLAPVASSMEESAARIPGAVGRFTREPSGKLTPGVRAVSRFGGSMAGGAAGSLIGHPEVGAVAGYTLGPSLMDSLLPEHPNPPGWSGKISTTMPKKTPFEVGSPTQEGGYYPGVTKVPIRPEPPYRLTPESVPGPDTAGKGNLLSPLAKAGDPRAAAELARRGRRVLYVPAEDYPAPRSRVNLGR